MKTELFKRKGWFNMSVKEYIKFSIAQRRVLDLLMQDNDNVIRQSDYFHGCCVTDKKKVKHYFTIPTFQKLLVSGAIVRIKENEPFFKLNKESEACHE